MDTPDPAHLLRNVANRRAQLEEQLAHGTWNPTADTMAVILRHTLGILQAVQVAVVAHVEPISS
jgi:hypothetical protein